MAISMLFRLNLFFPSEVDVVYKIDRLDFKDVKILDLKSITKNSSLPWANRKLEIGVNQSFF